MIKKVKTAELFECETPYLKELFANAEYPWEMLPKIKDCIRSLIEDGLEGFSEISEGVWVGRDVKIYPTVTIEAPAIIGHGCELRPGAFLRGNVITGDHILYIFAKYIAWCNCTFVVVFYIFSFRNRSCESSSWKVRNCSLRLA